MISSFDRGIGSTSSDCGAPHGGRSLTSLCTSSSRSSASSTPGFSSWSAIKEVSFHAVEAGRDETRCGCTRGVVRSKHLRSDGRSTRVDSGLVSLLLSPISLGVGCPLCAALAAPVDGALPDRARVTNCTE